MTRPGALAKLASAAMRRGLLLEYEPGERVVTSEPLTQTQVLTIMNPDDGHRHSFDMIVMEREGMGILGGKAFGYYVDRNV